MMKNGGDDILDLLQHAGRMVNKSLAGILRAYGLTPAQLEVLNLIWQHGELQQKQVIEARGVEAATVGTTLVRLERDGWVTRLPDPQDGRGRIIKATQKAVTERPGIILAVSILEKRLSEISGGKDSLEKMIKVLENRGKDE